jgi:hypothetical protein
LPATYEDLLARSPQASIFATRWWLDAVAPGAYDIIELRNAEGLQAAWPVVYRQTRAGREIHMPPLTQKLGILFAPPSGKPVEVQSRQQRMAKDLMETLGGFATFHQNFHEAFTDWLPFYWEGFSQTTRYTYVLEDISDVAALWEAMRPHHRQALRKAERNGVRVIDDLDLDRFLELNRKTFARQGKEPLASDEMIRRIDAQCAAYADRRIFAGVGPDGAVHAAVYVAWTQGTAYYLMGGGEPDLRDSAAQLLALWEAIKSLSPVVRRFDFEGSMLPQVERVFRGFGATQRPYFAISKAPPPPASLKEHLDFAIRYRMRQVAQRLPFLRAR